MLISTTTITNTIVMRQEMNKVLAFFVFLLSSCSIIPGMQSPSSPFLNDEFVYLKNEDIFIPIIELDSKTLKDVADENYDIVYKISPGDILTITIWGLPDAFPQTNTIINSPQNARSVDNDGIIFFPYIGEIKASGLTVKEIRNLITLKLSDNFISPQVDVTITKYNDKRKAYIFGEVIQPKSIEIGIENISLSDAIGMAKGLNPSTSNANKVFVLRSDSEGSAKIYKISLNNSTNFIYSNNFYIRPQDIIFVGAADITRWNRVIAQLFPFASFINQIDSINDR